MSLINSRFSRALILLLLVFPAASGNVFAQSSIDTAFAHFENTHVDTLSDAMYIDSGFMAKYNLHYLSQSLKRMKAWDNQLSYDSKDFIKICDIRWKFKSNIEAEAFHKKFIIENSESGEEITSSGVSINGVSDLKIYRESPGMRNMMKSMGKPMNFYYFIFVVNNTVAKVFVCTKPSVSVKEASVFAKEAARKLIACSGK